MAHNQEPAHDELLDSQGRMGGPWRRMLGTLLGLGTVNLRERRAQMDRGFADLGASALLAGPQSSYWRCDPIPFLLREREFGDLTAQLSQRAAAIEAMLGDLYGERSLLRQGILPPGLVYPSPHYVHACRGVAQKRHLQIYAADLVRGPDGAWRVLADRTARPVGLAYVLENRRAMAKILPEIFGANDIADIRPFFDNFTDQLQLLAGTVGEAPGLALLSPGHNDARWFENVALARVLGMALVEDGDLTVRDGALWIKTLRGLQAVHVLLRQCDGRYIDKLELRSDPLNAQSGTPGLLHAMRSENLVVVNSPGAGYAEAPALRAFLPRISEFLMGEELALPSVETHWLAHPGAQSILHASARDFIVRDALNEDAQPTIVEYLDDIARENLFARIAAAPDRYIATSRVAGSFAPCIGEGDTLEPRGIILRLYLVADGDKGFMPLPGGLARVLQPGDIAGGAPPTQALSKDVWVLREDSLYLGGSVNHALPSLPVKRLAGDLPSRVADNFYWFGRYLERLENAMRLMRTLLARLSSGAVAPHEMPEISVLCACLTQSAMFDASEINLTSGASLLALSQLTLSHDAGPVARMMGYIRDLIERLRDRLSGEMYMAISNDLRLLKGLRLVLGRSPRAPVGMLTDYCARVMAFAAMVSGYAAENMVHGGGGLFLHLGRRIERAQNIASQVRHAIDQKPERIEAGLVLALELCDSTITYRNRYINVIQAALVLDLVVADDGNPRGLGYQLAQARRLLQDLGECKDEEMIAQFDQLIVATTVIIADLLAAPDQAVAASQLRNPLMIIENGLGQISEALTRRYFALLPSKVTQMLGYAI